ncbi:FAD-dependent oxidoreductase [Skeletonema marinoi]|uniref:FAD-dependent oxidoreductase n=1 Tax=Skeletonema marinoi TaxID=267567 RepID=A0AAD9DFX6_9STRA|nr:FAD-dependent oxidoreductase [Skeletonema marinoi]
MRLIVLDRVWCCGGEYSCYGKDDDEEEEESDGCRILTGKEVNELMGRSTSGGNDLYQWGEYDPGCAAINPLKLTIGLANALERWGVRIYEGTKLTSLEKTNAVADESSTDSRGKYTLTTNNGSTIQCDHVVLCTGADTLPSDVSRRLEQSFVPIYTWMAATEPLYDECPLKDGVDNDISNKEQGQQENRPPQCAEMITSLSTIGETIIRMKGVCSLVRWLIRSPYQIG